LTREVAAYYNDDMKRKTASSRASRGGTGFAPRARGGVKLEIVGLLVVVAIVLRLCWTDHPGPKASAFSVEADVPDAAGKQVWAEAHDAVCAWLVSRGFAEEVRVTWPDRVEPEVLVLLAKVLSDKDRKAGPFRWEEHYWQSRGTTVRYHGRGDAGYWWTVDVNHAPPAPNGAKAFLEVMVNLDFSGFRWNEESHLEAGLEFAQTIRAWFEDTWRQRLPGTVTNKIPART
jgi:hypothetical protein